MVSRVKRKCSEPFLRPLFLSEQDEAAAKMYPAVTSGSNRTDEEARNGGDEDHYAEDCPSPVERLARLFRLDEAGIGALQGTIRRLEKGLRHATGPGIAGNKEERGIPGAVMAKGHVGVIRIGN